MLKSDSQPVYGLIFLFRYALDENIQEASCPDHVWFANQTHDFSCATVSLLNIVNNIPDVHLGEHLQNFKDYSKALTPDQRGETIANFGFVKQIHNSFARKMDMLNIDLGLQNAYNDRKTKKKATPAKKGKVIAEDDFEDDENAFHFVAYVPIRDEVWKLDGLDRQPSKVGRYSEGDWLSVAVPRITERISSLASGGIEFNLLSLVKDPVSRLQAALSNNVDRLQILEDHLDEVNPSWRDLANDDSKEQRSCMISGANEKYGVSNTSIERSALPASKEEQLKTDCDDNLIDQRQTLMTAQTKLRSSIANEQAQAVDDQRLSLIHI